MNILAKYKGIIIIAIVSLGAFAGYHFFLGEGSQVAENNYLSSTGNSGSVSEAEILGSEINKAIREIDSLKLDKNIFQHPILNRLEDRDKEITPQESGRSNPFAPLGSESASNESDTDTSGLVESLSE